MSITLHPQPYFSGKPGVPGDKSISHRALIFGALADGKTEISGLLEGQDVLSTWKCLASLGAEIVKDQSRVFVIGKGMRGFQEPKDSLDCGNSGTTLRLLLGVLAGFSFSARLIGDASLSKRPMKRISSPLIQMGAQIVMTSEGYCPLQIRGTKDLKAIDYSLPVASAQLKSALLLAGLFASGRTLLKGKIASRDHTERLLPHFGAQLLLGDQTLSLRGGQRLHPNSLRVPSDISSAAFWIAAAVLIPGSSLELENISLNPTRLGFLQVLKRMGAKIESEITSNLPEPSGFIRVGYSPIQGTVIDSSEIPMLIDELPLLAILAIFAEGVTRVQGAEELRIKETDRIEAVAKNLRAMGASVHTFPDGFEIRGPQTLNGASIESFHDHRIAMAFSIAALKAKGPTEIRGHECVNISYPEFYQTLSQLTSRY